MQIYIDESGGKLKGYFILTALAISEQTPLRNALNYYTRRKFKGKSLDEVVKEELLWLKGNASSNKDKAKFLRYLNEDCEKHEADYKIFYFKADLEALKTSQINKGDSEEVIITRLYFLFGSWLVTKATEWRRTAQMSVVINENHLFNKNALKAQFKNSLQEVYGEAAPGFYYSARPLERKRILLGVDLFSTGIKRHAIDQNDSWFSLFKDKVESLTDDQHRDVHNRVIEMAEMEKKGRPEQTQEEKQKGDSDFSPSPM